jgi:demethylmenaquinone methyltransferase / 2-methoxy-6-polyprenyl-1,4-benzoquinol methylase
MKETEKSQRIPPEKKNIRAMFNNIARRYDFLNHFLSLGVDLYWRKKVIKILNAFQPKEILDVATGTGDLAIQIAKIKPHKIIGIDIAEEMLVIANEKIKKKKLNNLIKVYPADSENLPFDDKVFDAVTVAFGVRNFENLEKGICEMFRVLKPGGKVVILEFSLPTKFPVKQLYRFYFKYILPLFGRIVSKNKFAYSYLPESVSAFPQGIEFTRIMEQSGFSATKHIKLTFGIASIYIGEIC